MKYGLFRLEAHKARCMCGNCKSMRNRWVKVSDRVYSTYETAAFVWLNRIVESKGNLFIRRCV